MKKNIIILLLLGCLCLGASYDRRYQGDNFRVARIEIAQQSWASGITTAATGTTGTANLNGICEQIEVVVSNATNGITFTVALASAQAGALFSKAAIAENATTVLKATSDSTDFDAFLACGTLTWTITPSGDPGASGVTVDVYIYMR